MIIVENLFKIKQLSKFEIIAGKNGLSRPVDIVTVMEVPEVVNYLNGNDFLITSLYAIGNDKEKQCELVKSLIITNSACLGIKLGKYVDTICDEAIGIANDNNFPILIIPHNVTYIDIIMNVMNLILTDKNISGVRGKLFKDILFEPYIDEESLLERSEIVGISPDNQLFQSIIVKSEKYNEYSDDNKLQTFLTNIATFAQDLKFVQAVVVAEVRNHVIILIGAFTKEELDVQVASVQKDLLQKISTDYKDDECKMSVGNQELNLRGMRTSYGSALKALQIGNILKKKDTVYNYDDLAIYCQLYEVMSQNSISFYKGIFDKINSEMLMETLENYYECNCNLNETALKMFTHKNTINYRISKIAKLTGLDVKNQEDNFKIQLLILENKFKRGY